MNRASEVERRQWRTALVGCNQELLMAVCQRTLCMQLVLSALCICSLCSAHPVYAACAQRTLYMQLVLSAPCICSLCSAHSVCAACAQRTLYMQLVLCRWTLTVQCDRQHLGAKHTGGQSVASQQRFNSFTGAFWLQALKLLGRLLTSQRSRSGQCMICRAKRLTAFCFALILVMFRLTAPRLMQSTCRLVARIRIILKWSFSYLFKALWSIYVPPV